MNQGGAQLGKVVMVSVECSLALMMVEELELALAQVISRLTWSWKILNWTDDVCQLEARSP